MRPGDSGCGPEILSVPIRVAMDGTTGTFKSSAVVQEDHTYLLRSIQMKCSDGKVIGPWSVKEKVPTVRMVY